MIARSYVVVKGETKNRSGFFTGTGSDRKYGV